MAARSCGKVSPPGHCSNQQRPGLHRVANQSQRERKIVDRVERSDGDDQVEGIRRRLPRVLDDLRPATSRREEWAGIANLDG
jgi:hypothetical protein